MADSATRGGFDPIILEWKGDAKTVPADRCMELLGVVEDALQRAGYANVLALASPMSVKLTALANCYSAALKFAGHDVAAEEVYFELQLAIQSGGKAGTRKLFDLGGGLLEMFVPSWVVDAADDAKAKARGERKAGGSGCARS